MRKNNVKDWPIVPAAAIAALMIETAGFLILGLLKPGYNPIRSTISELGERGGAHAGLAAILFIVMGILELVIAAGLYFRLRPSRSALIGSVFLAINGVFDYIGSGVFPCDAGGGYESFSGQMHFLVSVIGMSVMIFPAFFYWAALRKKGLLKESRLTLVAALLLVAGAVLFNIVFFSGASWLGLAQRILGVIYWGWLMVISWEVRRRSVA